MKLHIDTNTSLYIWYMKKITPYLESLYEEVTKKYSGYFKNLESSLEALKK
jgi:hypothetical protein